MFVRLMGVSGVGKPRWDWPSLKSYVGDLSMPMIFSLP